MTRLSLIAGLALIAAGCGGGEEPTQKRRRAAPGGQPAGAGNQQAAGGKAKPAGPPLKTYPRIADDHRLPFGAKDFVPDSTALRNRDPFRSYIIRQPGLADTEEKIEGAENEVCRNTAKKKNWIAPTYSLRDLKLLGIIMRGTRGYAQFADSSGEGWTVTQGNCLGVEKAMVTAIGSGVVRLKVQPEAPLGGTAPPPVQRDIPLYPEEYDVEETTAQ